MLLYDNKLCPIIYGIEDGSNPQILGPHQLLELEPLQIVKAWNNETITQIAPALNEHLAAKLGSHSCRTLTCAGAWFSIQKQQASDPACAGASGHFPNIEGENLSWPYKPNQSEQSRMNTFCSDTDSMVADEVMVHARV